jgi:hypothetical protein
MELTLYGNTIFIQKYKTVLSNRDTRATTRTEMGPLL